MSDTLQSLSQGELLALALEASRREDAGHALAYLKEASARPDAIASLSAYSKNLGLAFQIVDDLLDVEGDPAQTGKVIRADARRTTFVSFSGVTGARQLATELCETADRSLEPFGRRADRLRELSAFVAGRSI